MSYQIVVVSVRGEDPLDKFLALHSKLEKEHVYAEVRLKYEDGKIRRVLVEENVKF
jgi:hypothetical protein